MLKPFMYHNRTEAGCDEAGRGCLAGPVVAAAVILPKNFRHEVLNDSKKLTRNQRINLKDEIIATAIDWNVAFVDNEKIDELNILRASILAMHIAIEGLKKQPDFLLIDGNRFFPYKNIGYKTIIKGDGIYFSIAAASVLAKTFRDEYMEIIHNDYPVYNWKRNMGYPTPYHKNAILSHGISPFHRRSFHLSDSQLSIDF